MCKSSAAILALKGGVELSCWSLSVPFCSVAMAWDMGFPPSTSKSEHKNLLGEQSQIEVLDADVQIETFEQQISGFNIQWTQRIEKEVSWYLESLCMV